MIFSRLPGGTFLMHSSTDPSTVDLATNLATIQTMTLMMIPTQTLTTIQGTPATTAIPIAGTTTEALTNNTMIPTIDTVGMTSTKTHTMKNPTVTTSATIPTTATTECTVLIAAATHTSTMAAVTAILKTMTIAEATITTTIPTTQALSVDLLLPRLRPRSSDSKSTRRTGRWRTC